LEICDNNIKTLRYFPSSSFLDEILNIKNGMKSRKDFIHLLQYLSQEVCSDDLPENKNFW